MLVLMDSYWKFIFHCVWFPNLVFCFCFCTTTSVFSSLPLVTKNFLVIHILSSSPSSSNVKHSTKILLLFAKLYKCQVNDSHILVTIFNQLRTAVFNRGYLKCKAEKSVVQWTVEWKAEETKKAYLQLSTGIFLICRFRRLLTSLISTPLIKHSRKRMWLMAKLLFKQISTCLFYDGIVRWHQKIDRK